MLETVRVSKTGRDQLVTLKRRTGIAHWNVLCRWAFCVSLAEPKPPRNQPVVVDSSVEMTWRTFAGEHGDLFMAVLKQRCREDGMPLGTKALEKQFRLHLHRGIGYLVGDPDVRNLEGLIRKAL